jgi:type I site-specific restriction endonuclease
VSSGGLGPEAKARQKIDAALELAGWALQDRDQINLAAGRGVAIREFKLTDGYADYLLFVDGGAVGILEAKKAGYTLGNVEGQAEAYTEGLPENLTAPNVLAQEIADDLRSALEQIEGVLGDLEQRAAKNGKIAAERTT